MLSVSALAVYVLNWQYIFFNYALCVWYFLLLFNTTQFTLLFQGDYTHFWYVIPIYQQIFIQLTRQIWGIW